MSLETAMEKLATAMTEYAEVIKQYGVQVQASNAGETKSAKAAAPEKTAKAAGKTKPAAKDDDEGDDGFEEKKATKTAGKAKKALTHDDVKAKLLEVKNAAGDKAPALEIIGEFGYTTIPSVQEKDFDAIHAAAVEWLEENE